MSTQPLYEVVSPVGEDAPSSSGRGQAKFCAPPLADLNGKKIALIWTVFANGNIVLEAFARLLSQRYPGMEFIKMPPGRNAKWGQSPERNLTDLVRESGIDAAIVAAGC